MGKPAKSPWDFGELFPPEQTRRVFTVSELTGAVRRLLERELGRVWVSGEISNLRQQASGHIYFSIKDAGAQLACVCFRAEAAGTRHLLRDGQKVVLEGDLTVYEPRGQYQLVVRSVEPQGLGALQAAFERLKQRLEAEGLFAPERKRPLPRYVQHLGVVTSPTGAALQDVLHTARRRHPGLCVILVPCRVQGEGAAAEVAAGIALLNEWAAQGNPLDAILVTRGGGSLEDLWAFNEEIVARAIAASRIPVVSAVGHETDFSISDFVADVRAATPTAAAELLTEGMFACRQTLARLREDLQNLAWDRIEQAGEALRHLAHRLHLQHPRRLLDDRRQRVDERWASLRRLAGASLRNRRQTAVTLAGRLARAGRPAQALARAREQLDLVESALREGTRRRLDLLQDRLRQAGLRLRLLSPQNVLDRGYSITMDETTGKVLRTASETRPGQRVRTRLKEGQVTSVIQ